MIIAIFIKVKKKNIYTRHDWVSQKWLIFFSQYYSIYSSICPKHYVVWNAAIIFTSYQTIIIHWREWISVTMNIGSDQIFTAMEVYSD